MQTQEQIFGEMSAEEEAALSPEQEATEQPEERQEPVEQQQAEQQEKPAEEARGDKPPEGYVPHGALHAERERRKALEQEMQELRQWREQVEAKLNPPQEPEKPPAYVDPIADPEGHAKWAAYRERVEQQTAEQIRQFQQQQAQATEQQRMMSVLASAETQFRHQTADYDDAVSYLTQARANELQLLGYSEQQAQQVVQQEARGLVQEAVRMGRNPAEVAYGIAKARGYAPKAPNGADDGAVKAAAESARLQKIAEGAKSLGAASGGAASSEITLADVAEMTPEEIMALPDHVKKRVMGG